MKKFDASINGTKKISLGDSSYSGFKKQKDPQRKDNYISRHKKRRLE